MKTSNNSGKNAATVMLSSITESYLKQRQERNQIKDRIEQREKQIERLKKKLEKLPFWSESLIKPIAEELVKHFPDRCYDILGPFGLSSEIAIHFYRIGVDEKHMFDGDNCISITFRPGDLDKGELRLVDHKTNTGEFRKGTIGDMNGMNYPTIPLSPDTTIEELLKWVGR